MGLWTADNAALSADGAPGWTADGFLPIGNGIMPYVIGLELPAAQLSLQVAGVLVPASLGYFGTWPITVLWRSSTKPSGIVLSQAPAFDTKLAPNSPVTLTVSEYTTSVAYP